MAVDRLMQPLVVGDSVMTTVNTQLRPGIIVGITPAEDKYYTKENRHLHDTVRIAYAGSTWRQNQYERTRKITTIYDHSRLLKVPLMWFQELPGVEFQILEEAYFDVQNGRFEKRSKKKVST